MRRGSQEQRVPTNQQQKQYARVPTLVPPTTVEQTAASIASAFTLAATASAHAVPSTAAGTSDDPTYANTACVSDAAVSEGS